MDDETRQYLDDTLQCWLAAKTVIRQFLHDLCPTMTAEQLEHNAGAILVRLAHHEPPIMVEFQRLDD